MPCRPAAARRSQAGVVDFGVNSSLMADAGLHLGSELSPGAAMNDRRIAAPRRRSGISLASLRTWVGGRRRSPRRAEDRLSAFVDQWGAGLFAMVTAIVTLNFLDAWFTIYLLSWGGTEMNPLIDAVLRMGVWPFIAVKSVGIGICVAVLTVTSSYRIAQIGIAVVLAGYGLLVAWHFYLLGMIPSL